MTDKTLGAYTRTTPDPDETTGEALARLQAEMTRLLDEADAELLDEADGGVAAALIEQEAEESDAAPEDARQYLAARDEQQRLGRIVQDVADGDGHTTQVYGVKIAPCDTYGSTRDEAALQLQLDRAVADRDKAERERDEARATKDMHKRRADKERARAEKAEQERDEMRDAWEGAIEAVKEADALINSLRAAESRPLTPAAMTAREHLEAAMKGGLTREDIPNDMCDRLVASRADTVRRPTAPGDEYPRRGVRDDLLAALTEPPARPEGAEDVAVRLFQAGTAVGVEMTEAQRDALADHLAAMRVRVVGEDGAA
ncbi:hypothetical protein Y09_1359 [Brachybacterium sp. SW0106-09]|uniref:hypothetical protein n=1 Tax=Brachybacterium sp. SW0106-09 TaxID=1704590 RepID=UPI0006B5238A|nr:hypothetical protein [Brachybacterium sp. SW0106-09]GAP78530.1 hypothetical protein Y09_1359 [Brachybacterium sp. SW0106-09]